MHLNRHPDAGKRMVISLIDVPMKDGTADL